MSSEKKGKQTDANELVAQLSNIFRTLVKEKKKTVEGATIMRQAVEEVMNEVGYEKGRDLLLMLVKGVQYSDTDAACFKLKQGLRKSFSKNAALLRVIDCFKIENCSISMDQDDWSYYGTFDLVCYSEPGGKGAKKWVIDTELNPEERYMLLKDLSKANKECVDISTRYEPDDCYSFGSTTKRVKQLEEDIDARYAGYIPQVDNKTAAGFFLTMYDELMQIFSRHEPCIRELL